MPQQASVPVPDLPMATRRRHARSASASTSNAVHEANVLLDSNVYLLRRDSASSAHATSDIRSQQAFSRMFNMLDVLTVPDDLCAILEEQAQLLAVAVRHMHYRSLVRDSSDGYYMWEAFSRELLKLTTGEWIEMCDCIAHRTLCTMPDWIVRNDFRTLIKTGAPNCE